MKKILCFVIALTLIITIMCSSLAYASGTCAHENKYKTGTKISYQWAEQGHYIYTYDVYYCPGCGEEVRVQIEGTFEGHNWVYDRQVHTQGTKTHYVYYNCYPCMKTYRATFICNEWPCSIRYYSVTPELCSH